MVSTAGFLSSYQSINFSISSSSIVCLAKLTNRKRRLTLNSEGNPQQLTMELASLASLSFIMVRKRQLLGSCAVRDHWSWPGASLYFTFTFENYGEYGSADPLQLLLPYTDLEKNLLFNFHCSFRMVSSPREALILFLCDVKEFQRKQRHFHCI